VVSNTASTCRLRGYHPLRHRFPTDFDLSRGFLLCATPADAATTLPQPPLRNPCRVSHEVGLASSDFARHYSRNHGCFLFLWVLRCFTSPRSLHTPYFIQVQVTGHNSSWVSPFGHPRINARLPTPQGISQAPTSFIGSRCQGIHHVPLKTCPQQTTNTHKQHPSPVRADGPTCGTNKPRTRETINFRNNTNKTQRSCVEHARVHYPIIKQPEAQPAPTPSRGGV
jgi:hypothetical protein